MNAQGFLLCFLVLLNTWAGSGHAAQSEARMNAAELTRMREEVTERLQRYYIRHKGTDEPHAIPFAARMRSFFSSVQRYADDKNALTGWLGTKMHLSADDNRALAESIATGNAEPAGISEIGDQSNALQARMRQITDAAEAVEIGRKLNALRDDADALWSTHFEALLSQLSRDGRRSLEEYLHREIVPRMTYRRVDYAGLYAELAASLPQIKQLQAHGELTLSIPGQERVLQSPAGGRPEPFVGSTNVD